MTDTDLYDRAFFEKSDGVNEWRQSKLKYGDALAAVAYAHGVTFDELRAAVPFDDDGCVAPDDGLCARDQVARVISVARRVPRGLLDVGCGRGEVAVAMSQAGYSVQAVESSREATALLQETAVRFGGGAERLQLLNCSTGEAAAVVDWESVDTVVIVEALEHIEQGEFTSFYEAAKRNLRGKSWRLIVTNWIGFHPIGVGQGADPRIHCRRVDDALYDELSADASSVFFRRGSHLALDYAP